MDFLLEFGTSHSNDLFRCKEPYFSSRAKGNIYDFVESYKENCEKTAGKGLMCMFSGNHDVDRLARHLHGDELKVAFAFILSMPGAPFIYYGDEIGMRYVEGLKSVEGGYNRTAVSYTHLDVYKRQEVSCGAAVTCGVASTWLEAPALAAETSLFPEEDFSFAAAFEPEELLPFDWLVCACVPSVSYTHLVRFSLASPRKPSVPKYLTIFLFSLHNHVQLFVSALDFL